MRVAAHDQGYVKAPTGTVYKALAEPSKYSAWWPRARARVREGRLEVAFLDRRLCSVEMDRERPGTGLVLELGGALTGTLEWYLEAFPDGTIVNSILNLDVRGGRGRAARKLLRVRAALRRGMVALASAVEDPGRALL
ncbi:MAG: SRPBCC family protein [Actinomycetota bacterium]